MAFNTRVAYRDNNSWTSERGASKFLDLLITSRSHGLGDLGCVINGFHIIPKPGSLSVTVNTFEPGEVNQQGHCLIKYQDYAYLGWLENAYDLPLQPASQSGSRKSLIVAYLDRDVLFEKDNKIIESPDVLKFAEVPGDSSSAPQRPTESMIRNVVGLSNPYIILAELTIAANANSVSSDMISDLRHKGMLSNNFKLDSQNTYSAGVLAGDAANTKTKIVVTNHNEPQPAAQPGVQIIWLKKKA